MTEIAPGMMVECVWSGSAWFKKKLTAEAAENFKAACKKFGYNPQHIIAHGSYLINLGTPDPVRLPHQSQFKFLNLMIKGFTC